MLDVLREIQRARAMGVVCVAASGNGYRQPVGYPARYSQVLAVSAGGRVGSYPGGVAQELRQVPPPGADIDDYVADFSNIGSQISLIGPGVGIVSSVPDGYAVMDGTSMACPAATGALARRLSRDKALLGMFRDQSRSDAIVKLALTVAHDLGFPAVMQGAGVLV
jgi:subtilisin